MKPIYLYAFILSTLALHVAGYAHAAGNPQSESEEIVSMSGLSTDAQITYFEKNPDYHSSSYIKHLLYCGALERTGQFSKAKQCYQTMLSKIDTIYRSQGAASLCHDGSAYYGYQKCRATVSTELARLLLAFGEYDNVLALLEKMGDTPSPAYLADWVRGLAYALKKDTLRAHLSIDKLKADRHEAFLKTLSASSPEQLESIKNSLEIGKLKAIVFVHFALGEYKQAGALMQEVAVRQKKLTQYFKEHPLAQQQNAALLNIIAGNELWDGFLLAKIAYETGQDKTAMAGYRKLLDSQSFNTLHPFEFTIFHDYAMLLLKQRRVDEAMQYFKKSIESLERDRANINTEAGKIGFVGNKQQVYFDLIALLVKLGRDTEAFHYAERAKSRALVDLLAAQQVFGKVQAAPDVALAWQGFSASEPDNVGYDNLLQDEALAAKTRQLRSASLAVLQREAPELASLIAVDIPTAAVLQQAIPEDESIVEYYGNDKQLYAFVVTRRTVHAFALQSERINTLISAFREALYHYDNDGHKPIGKMLYQALLQPVEKSLSSKNLTVIPHGALHYLPFSALSTDNGYVLDRYRIRIMPSLTVFRFLKTRSDSAKVLALGNPDLGNSQYDLPGTQIEVNDIAKIKPDLTQVYLRAQATESVVKHLAVPYDVVHIAAHGVFNAEQPLRSGVYLAKDADDDGVLDVAELYRMQLDANLVTLSACETGLGQIGNGDDVIGLTRGFLYAGARSVIASFWQVSDESTAVLMQAFYKNRTHADKRTALYEAMLTTKNTVNQHPFFWAPFQLAGAAD